MVSRQPFTMRLKQDFIMSKLVAIESDIAEPKLGLSPECERLLSDNVNIIFHVAASVKFEAPLEVNLKHNVLATKTLLDVACGFEKLQCFIHVSTAYSNCQLNHIDERIYPMQVPSDIMALEVTKAMIDNRPNTYTYTKAMAENVASKYASRINVVIVRPSIVMSSLKEPAEGWVDTINGPVGLSVLGALGILQKIKVNSEVVFDLIPVDIVTNALVSIAWACTERKSDFLPGCSPTLAKFDEGQHSTINNNNNNYLTVGGGGGSSNNESSLECSSSLDLINNNSTSLNTSQKSQVAKKIEELEINARRAVSSAGQVIRRSFLSNTKRNLDGTVRVFNLTTGAENPCSFYHYFSEGRDEAYKKPSARALRPLLYIPKQKGMNPIQYYVHKIFSHLLFAYIVDALLNLFGQKKMVIKAVNRMHHANDMFDYFCSNQWLFVTDNVKKLRDIQSQGDSETFNCDVRVVNWSHYARIGWLGCRRFILKEADDTYDYAKRRYRTICCAYYFVKLIMLAAISALASYLIQSPIIVTMLLMPIYGVIYLL